MKGSASSPGRVRAIPGTRGDGTPHKIPHIGWSALDKPNGNTNWDGTILEGIAPGSTCYFVHSFTAEPTDDGYRLADCDYHGRRISAALRAATSPARSSTPRRAARPACAFCVTSWRFRCTHDHHRDEREVR